MARTWEGTSAQTAVGLAALVWPLSPAVLPSSEEKIEIAVAAETDQMEQP